MEARLADIMVPLPAGAGIVTATFPPPENNPWAEMVEAWSKARAAMEAARPGHRIILGQAKWHRMMVAADEADRASLERLREEGVIIVSPFLPATDEAYLFTPPADPYPSPGAW